MASSKRERELARQRAERQAARRAERARRRRQRNAVLGAVLAVLLVAGAIALLVVRNDDDTLTTATPSAAASNAPATSSATPSTSPSPSGPPGACSYPAGGQAARPVPPPTAEVERTQAYTATLKTSQGDIPLTLATADAPCTVHSFVHLAASNFFDDTPCHRLTDQGIFVLQCGDPSGTGRQGPGYSFPDENLQGATYPRGTVAMANSGPNTNGSQFFLVYKDSTLPPQYSVFGRITDAGLAVLDKVAAAGAAPADANGNTAPVTPVQISDVVVEPAAG